MKKWYIFLLSILWIAIFLAWKVLPTILDSNSQDNNGVQVNTWKQNLTNTTLSGWVYTWIENSTWAQQTITSDNILVITWDCSVNISSYNTLDIYKEWDTLLTPKTKDYKKFTKQINIIWNIDELYICVISNIRQDYKKFEAYKFSTYLYLWSESNAWNINTAFSIKNWVVYDWEWWWSKDLDWVFRGNEAPYTQVLNLQSVKVANMVNWWSKIIYPSILFKDWSTLRIWWYVNSYPNYRAWEILKLRIIYKWWEIKLVD